MVDKGPAKLWGFEFIFLLVVSFVNMGAFGMGIPIFPGYAVSLGATLSVAGVVTGMFSVVALIGRPFASIMGDRLNKKHLLIVSLLLNGFCTFLYAFVPSLALVIPLRFIHGLMFSVSGTVSFAMAATYVPKSCMGEGVGYMGIGQIVGMAVGPNISIFIAENFSFQLSFAISGVVIMASGLMVLALKYRPAAAAEGPRDDLPEGQAELVAAIAPVEGTPESAPASAPVGESSASASAKKPSLKLRDFVAIELMPNALFAGVFMLGNGLITSFLVMIGAERGIEGVGIFFIVNAIVVLLTRPMAGKLTDRKGFAFVILPGYILTAGAMLAIGMGFNVFFIVLAALLFACGAGTGMPAIQADCLMRLGRSRSSVATGTYFIGLDIGMTVGPVVGGIMADAFGFRATFNSAAMLMLVGFFVYVLYQKGRKRRAERLPPQYSG